MKRKGNHIALSLLLAILLLILLSAKPLHFGLVDHSHQEAYHKCESHSKIGEVQFFSFVKHCIIDEYQYFPVVKNAHKQMEVKVFHTLTIFLVRKSTKATGKKYLRLIPRGPPNRLGD